MYKEVGAGTGGIAHTPPQFTIGLPQNMSTTRILDIMALVIGKCETHEGVKH